MEAELFSSTTEPVIFLDRDGVINQKAAPHEYITDWENFVILPGVYEALKLFHGRKIFIVTNQRCIARKIATIEQINLLHEKMLADFSRHDCKIEKIFVCPHSDEDHCDCRKPKAGLLFQAEKYLAAQKIIIDKKNSWLIGDSLSDIQAGKTFGVNTILIDGVKIKNLLDAAQKILKTEGSRNF